LVPESERERQRSRSGYQFLIFFSLSLRLADDTSPSAPRPPAQGSWSSPFPSTSVRSSDRPHFGKSFSGAWILAERALAAGRDHHGHAQHVVAGQSRQPDALHDGIRVLKAYPTALESGSITSCRREDMSVSWMFNCLPMFHVDGRLRHHAVAVARQQARSSCIVFPPVIRQFSPAVASRSSHPRRWSWRVGVPGDHQRHAHAANTAFTVSAAESGLLSPRSGGCRRAAR